MGIEKLSIGRNPPNEINAVIEVSQGIPTVKYEMDKLSGLLFVDRRLHTSMFYPTHYGFIPHTIASDGDPLDILVVEQETLIPGCVIAVHPVGVLLMEYEEGMDEKILATPIKKVDPQYQHIKSYEDFSESFLKEITHFFSHYKDLEKDKWVKTLGWEGPKVAKKVIKRSMS